MLEFAISTRRGGKNLPLVLLRPDKPIKLRSNVRLLEHHDSSNGEKGGEDHNRPDAHLGTFPKKLNSEQQPHNPCAEKGHSAQIQQSTDVAAEKNREQRRNQGYYCADRYENEIRRASHASTLADSRLRFPE